MIRNAKMVKDISGKVMYPNSKRYRWAQSAPVATAGHGMTLAPPICK
ncbi:MAG: hypothetical protein Q7S01_00725 [bacterium]|nr:hypothetical protein [bacterium]